MTFFSFTLAPPRLVENTPSLSAIVNESVNLTCVFSGNFTPSVTWLFDGADVESLDTLLTIENSTDSSGQLVSILMIDLAKESDSGDYICVATNLLGSNQSSPISLIVCESTGVYPY